MSPLLFAYHYDVQRVIDGNAMTVTVEIRSTETQEIYCPGTIETISVRPSERPQFGLAHNYAIYSFASDNETIVSNRSDKSPAKNHIVMVGAIGSIVAVTCSPVPASPRKRLSERYISTHAIPDGNGPCTFVEYLYGGQQANYSCGVGFMPPYGCVESDTTQTCYFPSSHDRHDYAERIDAAFPGTISFRDHEADPGQDQDLARKIASLNAAAQRGDPFMTKAQANRSRAESTPSAPNARRTTSAPTITQSSLHRYQPTVGLFLLFIGAAGLIFLPKE